MKQIKEEALKNFYQFVGNIPTSQFDKLGLLFECDKAIAEAFVSAFIFSPEGDDSVQHCASSCKIKKACPGDWAENLGLLKEYRDVLFSQSFWLGNVFAPDEDMVERSADDFVSNQKGIDCAGSEDCDCCCEEKAAAK